MEKIVFLICQLVILLLAHFLVWGDTIIILGIAAIMYLLYHERLFGRFYTVESAHNSTGLGLSIAKTILERMNGTITAEYHEDKLFIIVQF